MLNRTTQSLFLISLLAISSATLPTTANAYAQDQQAVSFNLPAGELSDVLNQFSRQAKLTISYEEQDLKGISVAAFNGNFSVDIALFTLLQNNTHAN